MGEVETTQEGSKDTATLTDDEIETKPTGASAQLRSDDSGDDSSDDSSDDSGDD